MPFLVIPPAFKNLSQKLQWNETYNASVTPGVLPIFWLDTQSFRLVVIRNVFQEHFNEDVRVGPNPGEEMWSEIILWSLSGKRHVICTWWQLLCSFGESGINEQRKKQTSNDQLHSPFSLYSPAFFKALSENCCTWERSFTVSEIHKCVADNVGASWVGDLKWSLTANFTARAEPMDSLFCFFFISTHEQNQLEKWTHSCDMILYLFPSKETRLSWIHKGSENHELTE